MRRRKEYLSYFVLIVFLFLLLNLPQSFSWQMGRIFVFPVELFARSGLSDVEVELMSLRIENSALKDQIQYIRTWLDSQERIETHMNRLEGLTDRSAYSTFLKRRIDDLNQLIGHEIYSLEAKVIFRDPAFWGSGVWIDKGESHNRDLERAIIRKNSPVLVASSVVGIIEKVEEERSYVRLITDGDLTPAVRAVRGDAQNSELTEQITALEERLRLRGDVQGTENFITQVELMKEILSDGEDTSYLAKGEIRGSSYPLWRCRSNTLQGCGFNLEFEDIYSESKQIHQAHQQPLLKVGDLLVTSGLDGVFPAGLKVATVSKIFPLKEGGYSYDIEAKSTVANLNEISIVSILPPIL